MARVLANKKRGELGAPSAEAQKKAISSASASPSSSLEASVCLYTSRLLRVAPALRPLPSALFVEGLAVSDEEKTSCRVDSASSDAAAKALLGSRVSDAEESAKFLVDFRAASEKVLSSQDAFCGFCGALRRDLKRRGEEQSPWCLVVETSFSCEDRRRVVRPPKVREQSGQAGTTASLRRKKKKLASVFLFDCAVSLSWLVPSADPSSTFSASSLSQRSPLLFAKLTL